MEYTVQELIQMVEDFCAPRGWGRKAACNPKDLAIGISTEANELLDIFRFKSEKEMQELMQDPAQREHVGEELADVLFFFLRFTQTYGFEIREILEDKIHKNGKKYPVEEEQEAG